VCRYETNHFIIAFGTGRGPYPDVGEFEGLIRKAAQRVKLRTILADAGYDSEANHEFAREELSLRTIIPPKHGRPTLKPAKGRYRRLMQTRFDKRKYRKRAQVETVMSMIKRRQGSYCKGKSYWSRCRELNLMVLTHNIMILLPAATFLQSHNVCWPLIRLTASRRRLRFENTDALGLRLKQVRARSCNFLASE